MCQFEIAQGQLNSYRDEVEREPWHRDHLEAMGCFELESAIRVGIWLYGEFLRVDLAWRERMSAGALEYSEETDKAIRRLFRIWLEAAERILTGIDAFSRKSFDVEGSKEFRKLYKRARNASNHFEAKGL